MEKISITKALTELTLLDKRIEKAIDKAEFISIAKNKSDKVNPSMTKANFQKNATSALQSINALIERRDKIKTLIVQSNADTMVDLCGKKISVAMAIEAKNSIAYKEELLARLKKCYKEADSQKSNKEAANKAEVDKLLLMIFGTNKVSDVERDNTTKQYSESHPIITVDPLKIGDKIKEIEEYINNFKKDVDTILQISNCTTYIEL